MRAAFTEIFRFCDAILSYHCSFINYFRLNNLKKNLKTCNDIQHNCRIRVLQQNDELTKSA